MYTKNQSILHFRRMDFIACELYPNKAVTKEKEEEEEGEGKQQQL